MADQTGDIVKNISDDIKVLVRGEVELAKRELTTSAKNAGGGAGMFGGVAVVALWGLTLLFFAGACGFATLFHNVTEWSTPACFAFGFLAMALVLFIIAGILALIGVSKFKKVKGPDKAIAQASATAEATGQAITLGNAQVEAEVARRKAQAKKN